MLSTCSTVRTSGAERPRKRSVPATASERSPVLPSGFVFSANHRLDSLRSSRPSWTMPFESQPTMFLAPAAMMILAQATPEAPDAVDHDAEVLDLLADDLEGVDQGRHHHDGRAVLVVVEDGDVELLLQALLDLEAPRSRDVLQVDAAEGRRQVLDGLDDLVRVLGVEADRERVHVGELLEERRLALHDGHRRPRPDVPEPEHGRAVGDDGDGVALDGQVEGPLGVVGYRPADAGDARRVDHREVVAGTDLELGADLDLTPKVHQERPVRDVDNLDLRQIFDDLDDLLAVLGVAGVDGDVADGPVLAHPHDVDGADQPAASPTAVRIFPEPPPRAETRPAR